jgi:hypothetical protein
MQLLNLSLSKIIIWIKLVHLPMEFWSSECLGYVASGVGHPLYADSVTEEQLRLGYARVLVEVGVDSKFPRELELDSGDGQYVTIGVEYPWISIKCSTCHAFGHPTYACSRKEKKVWAPKKVVQQQEGTEVQKVKTDKQYEWTEVQRKVKNAEPQVFDKTVIRSAAGTSRNHQNAGGALSNSFKVLSKTHDVKELEDGEVSVKGKDSSRLHKILEAAVGVKNLIHKGELGKEIEQPDGEFAGRDFSPTVC